MRIVWAVFLPIACLASGICYCASRATGSQEPAAILGCKRKSGRADHRLGEERRFANRRFDKCRLANRRFDKCRFDKCRLANCRREENGQVSGAGGQSGRQA